MSELIVASCWGNKLTTKLISAWSKFPISVLLPFTICMWQMNCTVQAPHIQHCTSTAYIYFIMFHVGVNCSIFVFMKNVLRYLYFSFSNVFYRLKNILIQKSNKFSQHVNQNSSPSHLINHIGIRFLFSIFYIRYQPKNVTNDIKFLCCWNIFCSGVEKSVSFTAYYPLVWFNLNSSVFFNAERCWWKTFVICLFCHQHWLRFPVQMCNAHTRSPRTVITICTDIHKYFSKFTTYYIWWWTTIYLPVLQTALKNHRIVPFIMRRQQIITFRFLLTISW